MAANEVEIVVKASAKGMDSATAASKKMSTDVESAMLRVEKAQKAASEAEKKFGKESLEARDAANKLAQAQLSVASASNKLTKHQKDAEHSTKNFKTAMASAAGSAAGFLSAKAIEAGVTGFKNMMDGSIEAASNLGESMNAVNKIFGAQTSVIADWGKQNASSFGLSQRAFNDLAVPLGAGLKNSGMALQDTSRWTIDLTKRAADMASVFNTDVSDAMEAIQSGLRGEADPLERFGVGLSAAKVQAEAMAETGKKTTKSLSEQDLMTARLNLIMKQTESSAGDFTQTSGGLANSQRIAAARTEELQAKIGEKLIPVTLAVTRAKAKLVEVLVDKVLPAMERVGKWAVENQGTLKAVAVVVAGVLVAAFYSWATAAAAAAVATLAATWPILAIGAAIGLLVLAFAKAWEASATFRSVVITVIQAISDTFLGFVGTIINAAARAFGWVPGLGPKLQAAAREFNKFQASVNASIAGIRDTVYVNVVALVNGKRQTIQRAVGSANDREGRSAVARASGGVVGQAAAGGARGALTAVGEQGMELLDLPPGTVVHSNADARAMMEGAAGRSGGSMTLRIEAGSSDLDRVLLEVIRRAVRAQGGNVQLALGR